MVPFNRKKRASPGLTCRDRRRSLLRFVNYQVPTTAVRAPICALSGSFNFQRVESLTAAVDVAARAFVHICVWRHLYNAMRLQCALLRTRLVSGQNASDLFDPDILLVSSLAAVFN